MSAGKDQHIPVLKNEILTHLNIRADGFYVDGTFGRGGHSRALLEQLGPAGRLLVVDRDPRALDTAADLAKDDPRVTVIRGSFGDIEKIATIRGKTTIMKPANTTCLAERSCQMDKQLTCRR